MRELKASVVKRENYGVAYGWSCHIAGLEWALQRIASAATGGNEKLSDWPGAALEKHEEPGGKL